jgi:hypothetical protein
MVSLPGFSSTTVPPTTTLENICQMVSSTSALLWSAMTPPSQLWRRLCWVLKQCLSGLSIFSICGWVTGTQRLKPASGLSRFTGSTPLRRGYSLSTPPPARSPQWQYPGRGQGTPCLFCSEARHHFCSPFRPSSAVWQPPARFSFSSPASRLGGTSGCSKDSKYHRCDSVSV